MVVLFYGCKQTAHIEKDKYNFEPIVADSVAQDTLRLPERIVDTISMVVDSLPTDSIVHPSQDSIAMNDTLSLHGDSLAPFDSLRYDTLKHTNRRRFTPPRSNSAIEVQVICSASDSSYRDMNQKKIFYYGNAEAKYDDITLKADYLEFDLETSTCTARGVLDSLGKPR